MSRRTRYALLLLPLLAAAIVPFAAAAPDADTPPATPATSPAPATAATPATMATPATPANAPAPKLTTATPVIDVGKVARGEKVEATFELRNEGTAELVILDVRPTCGCTVANYDAKIAPGKSGKVHAGVDTTDFNGPIAKTLQVLTNDAATPRLTLTIKADVQTQIEMRPGFARYNYVQSQESITIRQWVWATSYPDFAVTGVDSPLKYIQASFHKALPDELRPDIVGNTNQWIVETTIAPDAEVGALRDFLVVKTNHPQQKQLRIPITGFVRPVLTVTPYVADFGAVSLGAGAKDLSLIVTNFGKEPVEITRVTAGIAGVEATVKPLEAGKRFEITLNLTPAMAKGAVNSTLKIETTSRDKPSIDVPLKGSVS